MPVYRIPPQPELAPDPAAPPDPARLVCGLAASLSYGKWTLEELQICARAAQEAAPVPMRRNHQQDLHVSGGVAFTDTGRWLRFAAVPGTGDGFPGGLVTLGEVYPVSAGLLRAMAIGQWMCLSIRGEEERVLSDPADWPGILRLSEVSLVDHIGNQADPDALVLGSGPGALTVWELLTGQPADL
jgi:hypothetical protein